MTAERARPSCGMEMHQSYWRMRFSFRNATLFVCFLNVVAALYLLRCFFSASSSSSSSSSSVRFLRSNSAMSRYIRECEQIRLSMQPLELMKRVREIQQTPYAEPNIVQPKQTAAFDLSKRLKDFRSLNDAASLKALEEWRKRKMERARQRQSEKNGTAAFQA